MRGMHGKLEGPFPFVGVAGEGIRCLAINLRLEQSAEGELLAVRGSLFNGNFMKRKFIVINHRMLKQQ
jgi:hypothetical protein